MPRYIKEVSTTGDSTSVVGSKDSQIVGQGTGLYDNTPTEEEIEGPFEEVRSIRDNLLVDSDWTQLPDAPLNEAEKESWRIYRQDLRDITEDVDSDGLLDPIWPTDPTGYTYSDEEEDNFVDSDGSS